jgi:hypothetical protein
VKKKMEQVNKHCSEHEGDQELNMELWTVIAGISGFDD